MVKSLTRLCIIALFVAWSFDFLFWGKPPGISFAVFMTLLVLGGVGLSLLEKRPPARLSLLLLLPLVFFAVLSFWRMEPFTSFINVLLSLVFLSILAITYRSGGWLRYGWADYAWRQLRLAGSAFSKPVEAWHWRLVPVKVSDLVQDPPPGVKYLIVKQRKKVAPLLRGLLLALPVVLVFSLLLSSADPIFGQGLENFFQFLKIENLPENLFRLTYILVIGYFLAGLYLHALTSSSDEKLIGVEKPLLPHFLGFTEAATILSSLNLLFAVFVGVQFRYFFGGQGNIHLEGFTYAEYARRGFSELVLVAFFTLLLFLALSTVARRVTLGQRSAFSALGAALTILVGVILVSAYQRLLLYEAAYGFTRLRTYTHVFMLCLGVLLGVLLVLELSSRLRAFTLASILVVVGFGVTLNLLPVDGFIARQNVLRAQQGADLDSSYLASLSLDAVDALWRMYNDPELDVILHEQIGGVLACQAALNPPTSRSWQSYNLSRDHAERLFQAEHIELDRFDAQQNNTGEWIVTVNHQPQPCWSGGWMD
jgi:preprotein translocase subunit SecG